MGTELIVREVRARAYTIPTDAPEADGTSAWDKTTIVIVSLSAGGMQGIGYTYADPVVAPFVTGTLAKAVEGVGAMDPPAAWRAMQRAVRNLGRAGLCATAISAVDTALWDLKAKLLGVPLVTLLGRYRDTLEIYGSGGFTSYDDGRLCEQLAGWVEHDGCRAVKMKVRTQPERDPLRVAAAKAAIGGAALYVDANGAYDVPAPMDVAAGDYGYDPDYFRRMLTAEAVDVQQADATRCGGVTGFLIAGALCEAFHTDLSGHCAPALHRHLGCAVPRFRNLEWFHDHVRIESMVFDGAPVPRDGQIAPDPERPGLELILKQADPERFAVGGRA